MMKSFKEVMDEQVKYEWMAPLLTELKQRGFALDMNYWSRTIYIFGDTLPQALGYDKLGEYLKDYELGKPIRYEAIEGNHISATVEYSMLGQSSDEANYFNDFVSKNASYTQDFGNDGNHPSGWEKN